MRPSVNIFWFRRDLRLEDNHGLFQALRSGVPVLPLFIFDTEILDALEDRSDRRVAFIHRALLSMQHKLVKAGSTLHVHHGKPLEVFGELIRSHAIGSVFTNHDYEPYATGRDAGVAKLLAANGIGFLTFKDQVLLEKDEVLKDDGKPYTVFTPYSRRWRSVLQTRDLKGFPSETLTNGYFRQAPGPIPDLAALGFQDADPVFPGKAWDRDRILQYGKQRDFPAVEGTTRLSVHLRFGTISVRELAREAGALSETFLNELIWRDFYHMILWHFPHIVHRSFKPAYDRISWRESESEFETWCRGSTGYPIVDAGMRELNATGFMHNRVRMITASFLTKHLLMDWRRGEAYFAAKLLDYDLAANNGGWQWAAGSGCDAAPYFRVFNPSLQAQKFDPNGAYIRRWVPEIDTLTYPRPMVDHAVARKRCLDVFTKALKG
ncbi:MAG: hypothetical protein RJA57_1822 [Bacteroidota bacterium]|jgi:deoxyribodipyrimidine photo-lyase